MTEKPDAPTYVDADNRDGPFRRYVVFCMPHYYPGGGFGDASGSADTLDDAKVMADYFEGSSGDDTQIFDCVERRVVG